MPVITLWGGNQITRNPDPCQAKPRVTRDNDIAALIFNPLSLSLSPVRDNRYNGRAQICDYLFSLIPTVLSASTYRVCLSTSEFGTNIFSKDAHAHDYTDVRTRTHIYAHTLLSTPMAMAHDASDALDP